MVTLDQKRQTGEFRQHGLVLVPSVAGIALVSVHGYSLGVMLEPLQQAFGWSRAEIMAGPMIISFISLLLCPVIGHTIDRMGPRPVAIAGVVAYGVLLGLLANVGDSIWSWWAHWALLGLASTIILPTVWTTAINSLFDIHRGKALAIALLGTGLSAALVPSLASALLDRFDWRGAYVALAAIASGVALVLVLLFFFGAKDRGPKESTASSRVETGLSAEEGFRSAAFRKLALGVFVFGATSLAFTINAVPVLESHGFARQVAAGVAGMIGIGSIVGRLSGGFLLDWFDARLVATVSVIAPVCSIAILLAMPGNVWGAGLAMLLLGLSLGAEVDACSYLAARHFGMRAFGTLFGTINGFVVFGSGMAPVVANYVYDRSGSYDIVLWGTAPLCLFAALLFASLGGYPDFEPVDEEEAVGEAAMAWPA